VTVDGNGGDNINNHGDGYNGGHDDGNDYEEGHNGGGNYVFCFLDLTIY